MDNPPDDGPCEVTITAPDREWLQAFVRQLVVDRLAAAAHVDIMHTTYRWNGEVHTSLEARARLHSIYRRLPEITQRTAELHEYDVPCVVATGIQSGSTDYLEWVVSSASNEAEAFEADSEALPSQ